MPNVSATARFVTWPACMLTASARPGSCAQAAASPEGIKRGHSGFRLRPAWKSARKSRMSPFLLSSLFSFLFSFSFLLSYRKSIVREADGGIKSAVAIDFQRMWNPASERRYITDVETSETSSWIRTRRPRLCHLFKTRGQSTIVWW